MRLRPPPCSYVIVREIGDRREMPSVGGDFRARERRVSATGPLADFDRLSLGQKNSDPAAESLNESSP